jgi:hypothetical protein
MSTDKPRLKIPGTAWERGFTTRMIDTMANLWTQRPEYCLGKLLATFQVSKLEHGGKHGKHDNAKPTT